jgi:Trk K+ transport system NAD-binding subunit
MNDLSRRVGLAVIGGIVLLVAYATVYRWGMAVFEGQQRSYIRALQVVLEILTTAGFGGDAPWTSPEMSALIIAMNLTGVGLVFFAIPFFLVPLLENAIRTDAPTESGLTDHIVVCADSPREQALHAEISGLGIPELFVKRDSDRVKSMVREGTESIHGNPETAETLRNANLESARALVVDISDEINANIILTARRLNPEIQIVSVVEDEGTESYHRYAGADTVIQPRVAVGERLAARALGPQLFELPPNRHPDLPIRRVFLGPESELIGETLASCSFRQQFGATVVGGWFHGELVAPVESDRRLVEHAVLLLVGEPEGLATVGGEHPVQYDRSSAVVAGYGVVGRTVAETLTDAGVEVTVVDTESKDGVDIVGDITNPEIVARADLANADVAILSLSRDSLVVYAGLVIEDHASAIETLARADDTDYVQNCYDAGIEYTLALSEVTAHMIATRLFESHAADSDSNRHTAVQKNVGDFAGTTIDEADIRASTGAQILGIERAGTLELNPDADAELRSDDSLLLTGTDESLAEFDRQFGSSG